MSELDKFFLSTNRELSATVNRLDKLIGKNHWLSVGTYKEALLKNMLKRVIPKKYSVNSGFIMGADQNGEIIRSAQTDILIWDSHNYSPLFCADDFVIIPPEACKIMIEVKSSLRGNEIKNTIKKFDKINKFKNIPNMGSHKISKFIFAYKMYKMKFPDGIFNTLYDFYTKCEDLSIEDRMSAIDAGYNGSGSLYILNGIFILSEGCVICSEGNFKDNKLKLLFNSYTVNTNDEDIIYSFFENIIISLLGNYDQYGLYSLRRQLEIKPSIPKSLMVIPKTDIEYYPDCIGKETIFDV